MEKPLKCPRCQLRNKSRIFAKADPEVIVYGEATKKCRDCGSPIVLYSATRTASIKSSISMPFHVGCAACGNSLLDTSMDFLIEGGRLYLQCPKCKGTTAAWSASQTVAV